MHRRKSSTKEWLLERPSIQWKKWTVRQTEKCSWMVSIPYCNSISDNRGPNSWLHRWIKLKNFLLLKSVAKTGTRESWTTTKKEKLWPPRSNPSPVQPQILIHLLEAPDVRISVRINSCNSNFSDRRNKVKLNSLKNNLWFRVLELLRHDFCWNFEMIFLMDE